MKYLVVFEKTSTGYGAYLPDLPGCIATGKTREEVEKNISEAISFHIAGMIEDQETISPPESFAEYRDVEA